MIITNYKKFEECMQILTTHLSRIHIEYVEGHVYLYLEHPYNSLGINIAFYDYGHISIEYYGTMTDYYTYNIEIKENSFHLGLRGDSIDINDFDVQQEYFQYSIIYPFSKEFYLEIQEFRKLMDSMNLM